MTGASSAPAGPMSGSATRELGRVSKRGEAVAADPPPDPPNGTREAEVRDLGEAELVLPKPAQKMREPVGGGQLARIAAPHAPAVHAPAARANEVGASASEEPDSELAALEREPGRHDQLAFFVAEQVPQKPKRDPLRPARGPGEGGNLIGSAASLDPRDQPRMGEADRRHWRGERLQIEKEQTRRHEHGRDPRCPHGPATFVAVEAALADVFAPPQRRGLVEPAARKRGGAERGRLLRRYRGSPIRPRSAAA